MIRVLDKAKDIFFHSRTIEAAIIFLAVVIAITLVSSVIVVVFEFDKYFTLLPGIAIACTASVALLTYLRDKKSQGSTLQRKKDETAYDLIKSAFQDIGELLSGLNNDRMSWLHASRLLIEAQTLKKTVVTEDIAYAVSVEESKLRARLYQELAYYQKGEKQPLPAKFFYGIKNWQDSKIDVHEAARQSSSKIEAHMVETYTVPPVSQLQVLHIPSVVAIYDFLLSEDAFTNHFESVEVWRDGFDDLFASPDSGARRFVLHCNNYMAVNGELHERGKDLGAQ